MTEHHKKGTANAVTRGFSWGVRTAVTWILVSLVAACGGSRSISGTDVSVTGSGPQGTLASGTVVSFTMTVQNVGKNPASNITLTDQVSAELTQPSITCVALGGATCPQPVGFVMSVPSLPVGGQLVFTVTATVSSSTSGSVTNSMSARVEDDVNTADNTSLVTANVSGTLSNLVVTGLAPTGTIAGGGTAEFVMTVRNDGPDPATTVKVVNTIGGNMSVSGVTCIASGGATCPTGGVVMSFDSLPAGGSLEFHVMGVVQGGVSGALTNSMSASAANDNPLARTDNSATVVGTAYTAKSGVFVTATGPTAPVAGGSTAVFTMVVTNSGPDDATDVKMINTVGSNLTLTSVACAPGGGATCPSSTGVVMSVPLIPANGVLTFTVSATVGANVNGAILNTLTATPTNDPNRSDNSAVAVGTASTSRAALTVTGVAPAGQVAGGDVATSPRTVGTTAPDEAQNVRIVDTVGGNLTLTGVTCTAASGATCPTTGAVMTVPSLPVGGTLAFAVQTKVANGTSGSILNTMSASASNGTGQGASAVTVGQAAVSALSVTGVAPSNVPAGTSTSFTMTVANAGPLAATNLQLVNTVGGNLTFAGATCTATGDAVCPTPGVVMTVPTLSAGSSLIFRVNAAVASGTNGAIVNTLVASTTSGSQNQTTGTAVGSAYATRLGVAATGPAGPLAGGAKASFSMVVSNTGPGTAINVVIGNTASSGIALDGGGASITCLAAAGAVCPTALGTAMLAPSIPPNGTLTFTVPVTVNANANGTATNTMTAAGDGDIGTSPKSASASVSVFSADLGVSQTGPSSVNYGDSTATAIYTAIVSNPGPGAANNVAITLAASNDGTAGSVSNVTCTPAISCPASLGTSMTLASLGAGRSLTFTFAVPVLTSSGTITSTVTVAGDGDTSTGNNTAVVTTQRIDPRSGTYRVYAADGREYSMAIDFDALTYTLSGNSLVQTRSFTLDSRDATSYITSGSGERFRVATDLLVGNHAFGSTALPYVAARTFATSLGSAANTYNLATRSITVNSDGSQTPATRAGTARVVDNVLYVCQSDVLVSLVQNCAAADLKTYSLSVSGDLFRGVNTATGNVYQFRIAQSGALGILVRAGVADGASTQELRVGLPDAPALVGGTLVGPYVTRAGAADWTTLVLSSSSVAVTGVGGTSYTATLARSSSSGGPFSMLVGPRSTDLANIWVLQASPLVVLIGECGCSLGGASGDLQFALP